MENIIIPTIGRVVYYKMSQEDADAINKRRDDFNANKAKGLIGWSSGAQAHVGNRIYAGEICAAIIVKVWSNDLVNLKVLLDGNDDFWGLSVNRGEGERQWDWMPFQKSSASNSQSAEPKATATSN